ncbi:MAG TPA: PAS domain-containing protein [Dehalococcoidia bacterium]|nr:PAS domain-containing protein [Dehalococcoidia bacterium]
MTEEAIRERITAQHLPDPDGVLVARLARRALTEATGAQILDEAVNLVQERLGVDAVLLLEQVPTGEGFTMRAGLGWSQTANEVVVPRLAGSEVDYVSQQSDVVVIPDLPAENRFRPMPFLLENGVKSSVTCPIQTEQGVSAIISAHSRTPREFTGEESAFLASVAGVISATLERRDAEAALAESEERLRMALKAGGMGAWEWRVHSGEVIWSEELERIHGLQPGTFGGTFEDYQYDMHPADRDRVLTTVQESLDVGEHLIEYRIIRPDGQVRWLSARGELIRDPDGRPLRMIGVCTDTTEARAAADERDRLFAELQSAEARYRSVFAGVGDTILITNSRGVYVDVNPAGERLLGFTVDEYRKMHISDVVVSGLEWSAIDFEQFVKDGFWSGEVELRRKDGSTIDVEVNATVMPLLVEPVFVAVIRNISDRKRTAATLARSARQQAAVAELGLHALSASSIRDLMDEAVASLSATLGLEYAKVLELQEDGKGLLLRSGVGWNEGLVGSALVSTGPESQAAHALRTHEPVVVTDLATETRFRGTRMLHDHHIVSGISVTIRLPDRIYGVLGAHTTERREFTNDEVNFLQAVANILSAAVERREHSQELQRLVSQLEMERQRVDNLVANVPGVVWEAYGKPGSGEQRIDFVSDHVEEMLGYSVDEWLETPNFWLTIVHPDDRERAATVAARDYESGEPSRNEFRWIAKDGRVVWVEAHSTVIRDAQGRVFGQRGVTMDITSRRQADNRLREYAWTLETVNRINLALSRELNLEHVVQQVTDAATRLTSAELGWFVYTLAGGEPTPSYQQYSTSGEEGTWTEVEDMTGIRGFLDVLKTPGSFRCDDVAVEERCAESRAYLDAVAGVQVGALIAIPVTTRTPGACGVLALAHSAKGVFTERAEQISAALAAQATIAIDNSLQFQESQRLLEELRRANESKDEFLGLVSHELRTPITTIFGGARLLRSRGEKIDAESRGEILEDIEREAERLHRIVEDLLVLARIELGQEITMEPVLLRRVAERTIWAFSRQRAGRTVEMQMDSELSPVYASATYMEQILRNLITNADKYSPPGTPIDLSVRRVNDEAIVSVMDRGPGLPPEELDLIFERFYRSSETSGQASGAGIGLTVCKRLMDAQGGRIWAEARPEGGLCVSLALPVYDEPD